jgi:hypothetical protein
MTSQRFSFLLILIMVITPVTSVLSHYSSIAGQLLAEHITVMLDSVDDASHAAALDTEQCHQHNKPKLSCDTNSLCSFSICGYGSIAAAFLLLIHTYSVYRYRQKNKTFPRSFAVPPEIKPPIYRF